MEEKKVGIDLLEKFVIEAVDVFEVAKKKLADGWDWTDAIPIVMEAKDLSFMMTNWTNVKAQIKDLDAEESKILVISVANKLGYAEGKTRNVIEKSLNFAVAGYNLYQAIIEEEVSGEAPESEEAVEK